LAKRTRTPPDYRLGELLTRAGLLPRARLGDILLGAAAVSEHQLLRALLQQERTGEPLGEILVRQGVISVAVREGALGFQRTLSSPLRERFRLGRLLLEAGIVDPVTLEAAIRRQRGARVKLGDALLEMGAVTQDVLEAFLKRQRRLLAALAAGMAVAADAHGLPARGS